jgi:hypothetical protein
MAILAAGCSTAWAAELRNFINDLYGGNGLNLSLAAPGHTAHFSSESQTALSDLDRLVVGNVGLATLTPTTSIFNFNILQGVPTETSPSLGPIFGERAETLGQGKVSIAFSGAHQNFTTLNGQSLNDIPLILNHQDPVRLFNTNPPITCTKATTVKGDNNCDFILDQVRLDVKLNLTRNVFAAYAEYGITDRWDIGIVLPVIEQTAQASSFATVIHNGIGNFALHGAFPPGTCLPPATQLPGNACSTGTPAHALKPSDAASFAGGTASGIGDVIVRTKYNFWQGSDSEFIPDMAVVGQINLPTGDQQNLLGSGSTDVLGGLVLSKQIGLFAPHFNVGYQIASGGFDRNNLLYAAGADFSPSKDVTVAADFIGRWFTGPPGYLNTTDFSIGAKWRPFGQNIFMVDFLIPINKGTGLRSDYVAFAAYQVTF